MKAKPYYLTAVRIAEQHGRMPTESDERRAGWYLAPRGEPRGPFESAEQAAFFGALHPEIAAAVRSGHTGEQRAALVCSSIARGMLYTFGAARVLSIDAWRDGSGWFWNNWHHVGWFPLRLLELKPRAMFREMRERGYLSAASAGRVSIDDDGYNVTVCDRGTGEPLFAIEYGSILQ